MSITQMVKRSTIQVSEELRNALKELGKKGESYEDILWRILGNPDFYLTDIQVTETDNSEYRLKKREDMKK